MAQPLASRIGAMFLWRSFKYARIIEGREIKSRIRIIAKGSFHPSLKRFAKTPTTKVVIPLMATLRAAIVPTSIFLGTILAAAAFASAAVAGTLASFTAEESLLFIEASLSAAALAIFY